VNHPDESNPKRFRARFLALDSLRRQLPDNYRNTSFRIGYFISDERLETDALVRSVSAVSLRRRGTSFISIRSPLCTLLSGSLEILFVAQACSVGGRLVEHLTWVCRLAARIRIRRTAQNYWIDLSHRFHLSGQGNPTVRRNLLPPAREGNAYTSILRRLTRRSDAGRCNSKSADTFVFVRLGTFDFIFGSESDRSCAFPQRIVASFRAAQGRVVICLSARRPIPGFLNLHQLRNGWERPKLVGNDDAPSDPGKTRKRI